MTIKELESLIIDELKKIITQIVIDYPKLNISAKSRAGAELSNFLEKQFIEYIAKNQLFQKLYKVPKRSHKKPVGCKNYFLFQKFKRGDLD